MGAITRMFGPKLSAPQAPPPAPVVDQATIDRQAADIARRRRGVAATQLVGASDTQKLGG